MKNILLLSILILFSGCYLSDLSLDDFDFLTDIIEE